MADGKSYERARAFRKALTPPEARLWSRLKGRSVHGIKFRKQHPVGPYILDFYCAEARLAVEVDGSVHDDPKQLDHDRRRSAWLSSQRVRVIRVAALGVLRELDGVLEFVAMTARERLPSASPPPSRRTIRRSTSPPLRDGEEI